MDATRVVDCCADNLTTWLVERTELQEPMHDKFVISSISSKALVWLSRRRSPLPGCLSDEHGSLFLEEKDI